MPALCQSYSLGVKLGVPTGESFTVPTDLSAARRYLVGGTAELHLPFRLSIELDGIYKRTGLNTLLGNPLPTYESATAGVRANQWEFPLLGKYELKGAGPVRLFVDGGPVLRHIGGIAETITYTFLTGIPTSTSITSNSSSLLSNRNTGGFAIGGGVTLKLLSLRISPELRYTRWSDATFVNSSVNQADVMVGVTF